MLQTTQTEPTAITRRPDTAGPLAVATPTVRQLADASISLNTRRAYAGALRRLDAWLGTAPVNDASLAVYRRAAADRGRGQAKPMSADNLAAILATAERPRKDGRGIESTDTAQRRGLVDSVIAGLLIAVRQSKTNQEGDAADVRYLKNGAARAIRTLRAARPDVAPTDRVIGLSPLQIQRRLTDAARAAGIEARLTAHSGRVGLASELTARGASTTETMLAGNWKTSRMVAHYSAGATAERGAVKKFL